MNDEGNDARGELARLRIELARLKTEVSLQTWLDESVASSLTKRAVWEPAMAVAATLGPILIVGERGLGKTALARAIHLRSDRAHGPLLPFDAAAIAQEQHEAELFGDAAGLAPSAILRRAAEGTVVLSNFENLSAPVQERLAEFLRSARSGGSNGASAARFIWICSDSPYQATNRGTLRRDLLAAISKATITIPPLRHRREEIPLLAQRGLVRAAKLNGSPASAFSSDALSVLQNHAFRGNLPELEETVERAALSCREPIIQPAHLPDAVKDADRIHRTAPEDLETGQLPYREAKDRTIQRFEQSYFSSLLDRTGGNVSEAARQAGLDRSNFRRALRRAGIRGHSAPASRRPSSAESPVESEEEPSRGAAPPLARPRPLHVSGQEVGRERSVAGGGSRH